MKKTYIKPQIIAHTIQFSETLLTGSDTKVGGASEYNSVEEGPEYGGSGTGDDM